MLCLKVRFWNSTQKAHGIRMARLSKKRINACALYATACIHNHDVISSTCNNTKVVSNQNNCCAGLFLCNLQDVKNLSLNSYVKSSGWLVSNDDVRIVCNSNCNNNTLTHTARELMWERIQTILWISNTNNGEKLNTTLTDIRLAHMRIVGKQSLCKLISNREHWSQSGQWILEDHRNLSTTKL